MKKKCYVLMVSRKFPTTHQRAGQETGFAEKILSALGEHEKLTHYCFQRPPEKIHTIRSNYELWEKRVKEIQEGKAYLSIRHWMDKPYRSKHHEIATLNKVGIEKVYWDFEWFVNDTSSECTTADLAKNDGLSEEDFKEWFKHSNIAEPMAIIHLTDFRYSKTL